MTFLYAGSLYYNRNPFPLLDIVKELHDESLIKVGDITFLLYGDCESWNGISLIDWINANNMREIVKIHDFVSVDKINEIMEEVDVLVNFCQGQPLQIPAKTFDYMATGKQCLVVTEHNSDTANLIKEAKIGKVVNPNVDDIKNILLDLYNEIVFKRRDNDGIDNSKSIRKYSRYNQNTVFIELIKDLILKEEL